MAKRLLGNLTLWGPHVDIGIILCLALKLEEPRD